jgi:hypothetical protein
MSGVAVVLVLVGVGSVLLLAPPAHASGAIELYSTPLYNDAHLLCYYRMEGGSSDNAPNAYCGNGADYGISYATSTGAFGQVASFNGTGADTITANNYLAAGSSSITVSAWVYIPSVSGAYRRIASNAGAYGDNFILRVSNANKWEFFLSGGLTGGGALDSPSVVATGSWQHVAGVWDGSVQWLYLNGVAVASTSCTGTWTNGTPHPVAIGTSVGSEYWNGSIDDLAIFNHALTATEIADLYNGTWSLSLSSPHQYKSDATTTIPEGGTTNEGEVVFGATLNSMGTSTLQLQVEATTSPNFSDIPNVTSSISVSSGTWATTTFFGANGSYHWQARVKDANGATSTWQLFGPNSTSTDFIIDVPSAPPLGELYSTPLYNDADLVSYYRFEDNSSDAKGSNNGSDASIIYNTSSAMFGEGASFNGSNTRITTPVNLPTSSWAGITVTAWAYPENTSSYSSVAGNRGSYGDYFILGTHNTNWRWHILSAGIEDIGASFTPNQWYMITGTWDGSTMRFYVNGAEVWSHPYGDSFGNSPRSLTMGSSDPGGFWEEYDGSLDDLAVFSRALTGTEIANLYNFSLNQYRSDATTTIPEGGITTEGTVVFGATLYSMGTNTEQLQVEIKPVGIPFTNIPTATSSFISPGNFATTSYAGDNGSYHWQARVVDSNNASSSWRLFGTNTNSTDFSIAVAKSLYLNGSSSLDWPAANVDFLATDPFTVQFWYNTTSSTSTVVNFIDSRDITTHKGFSISRDQDAGIHFLLECDSGIIDFHAASSSAGFNGASFDTKGIWHNVAVTKNNSTSSINAFNLYYDGVAQVLEPGSEGPISGNCFTPTSTDSIWLGRTALSTSTQYWLTGYMDEVQISNVEKSYSDIRDSWGQEATSVAGFRGLWQFNGNSLDLVTSNATSGQIGDPLLSATTTPFGHFLLNQLIYPTAAHSSSLLWYPSSTQYSTFVDIGAAAWNALGGINIVSTTISSNATLIVSDFNDGSDRSWTGRWSPFPTSSQVTSLLFNTYAFSQYSYDSYQIQNTATHELGHALGLDHSYIGNIMNYYTTRQLTPGSQDTLDFNYLKGQELWSH